MAGYRAERVAEMIHKELAQRLRLQVKDPELTPISITHVEVSRDLGRAKVHFMSLGGGEVSKSLRGALDRAAKRLRGPIGRSLRLRTAPEIIFVEDQHTHEAVRLTTLLSQLEQDGGDEGEE